MIDGVSGLNILRSSEPIDLLITDVGLPGINGRHLADQARQHAPGLKVVFMTGYARNAISHHELLARRGAYHRLYSAQFRGAVVDAFDDTGAPSAPVPAPVGAA